MRRLERAGLGVVKAAEGGPALPAQQPRVVDPGKRRSPPSDSIVLFDGKDMNEWTSEDGQPAAWPVSDGVMTCKSDMVASLVKQQPLHMLRMPARIAVARYTVPSGLPPSI